MCQGFCTDFTELFHAEIVPHADVKIGLCRQRMEQCAGVQCGVAHLGAFRVSVTLDAKGEGASDCALGVKAALLSRFKCCLPGFAALETIKIFSIRQKVGENRLRRHPSGKREQGCFAIVGAGYCSVFEVTFHGVFG